MCGMVNAEIFFPAACTQNKSCPRQFMGSVMANLPVLGARTNATPLNVALGGIVAKFVLPITNAATQLCYESWGEFFKQNVSYN